MTDVHADVGEAGVEERLHLLLDRFGQGLAAAAGLEHEIRRQGEGVAGVRLHCPCGGVSSAGSAEEIGGGSEPQAEGRAVAGCYSAGSAGRLAGSRRGLSGRGRRAGLDRGRGWWPNRRQGRTRGRNDPRLAAGEEALDHACWHAMVVRLGRTGRRLHGHSAPIKFDLLTHHLHFRYRQECRPRWAIWRRISGQFNHGVSRHCQRSIVRCFAGHRNRCSSRSDLCCCQRSVGCFGRRGTRS